MEKRVIPKRVIIIGGGSSIRQNLWHLSIKDLPLWKNLEDEFTIGLNWTFKFFESTILMYGDYQFYGTEKENLKNVPLILGKFDGEYERKDGLRTDKNVLLLKECESKKYLKYGEKKEGLHPYYWGKKAWTKGWYCSQLAGLRAINLVIALDCTEIYLLGYDATDINGHTHFYDDTNIGHYIWNNQKHTGIGKDTRGNYNTGNYNKIEELNNFWFAPFKKELQKGIKIYNVSPKSKIDTFPKIDYVEFYMKLAQNKKEVNHEKIRKVIRKKYNMSLLQKNSAH